MGVLRRFLLATTLLLLLAGQLQAAEKLGWFDRKVKSWATECRDKLVHRFSLLLSSGQTSLPQLFDTFYLPIPGTDPQKFHTQYDQLTDKVIQPLLDDCLERDPRLVFFVAVDRNGYLPTHNTRFSRALTGNALEDARWNRTKRIFNDRTGLAAARNLEPYLLQQYQRDTGEMMSDLSLPIFIQGRHWGAIRVGYRPE